MVTNSGIPYAVPPPSVSISGSHYSGSSPHAMSPHAMSPHEIPLNIQSINGSIHTFNITQGVRNSVNTIETFNSQRVGGPSIGSNNSMYSNNSVHSQGMGIGSLSNLNNLNSQFMNNQGVGLNVPSSNINIHPYPPNVQGMMSSMASNNNHYSFQPQGVGSGVTINSSHSINSSNCGAPTISNVPGTRTDYNHGFVANGYSNDSCQMEPLHEIQGTEDFLPEEPRAPPKSLSVDTRSSDISTLGHYSTDRSSVMQLSDSSRFGNNSTNSFLSSSMSLAPEQDWKPRNSLFLEELEEKNRNKRRRSSVNVLKYAQLLQAIDSDSEDDDDAFDKRINDLFSNAIVQSAKTGVKEDSMRLSMASLGNSLNMSIGSTHLASQNKFQAMRKRSVRFSLISPRSTRMSLILRQSCISNLEDEDESRPQPGINAATQHQQSQYVPDIFWSQKERRRSSITESSAQLIAAVYGLEAAEKLSANPGRMSACLQNIMAPSQDDIMMEIDSQLP